MPLNLRQVELFLCVARELHFTNAARRLNMAQPALSRAIRSLEQELGVRLLHRNTRLVELTQAGRVFQTESQAGVDRLARAVSSARSAADGEIGSLTIGYMDFALEGLFPRLLKEFRSCFPGVSVRARSSCTQRIARDLRNREIDLGFVVGPVAQAGLASLSVQADRYVAVLPDSHPLAARPEISLRDLSGEPMIMGRRETWAPYPQRLEALCRAAGFIPEIIQEADSKEGILAFVAAGMGVTIYVDRAFTHDPPGIVIRPLTGLSESVTTDLAWRAEDENPIVRHFVALTRDMADDA